MTEAVNLSFHETYYCLSGEETDNTIRVTAATLHGLAEYITEHTPRPSLITNAHFIRGTSINLGDTAHLVKNDGYWYDDLNTEYTEEDVLRTYKDIEVIR